MFTLEKLNHDRMKKRRICVAIMAINIQGIRPRKRIEGGYSFVKHNLVYSSRVQLAIVNLQEPHIIPNFREFLKIKAVRQIKCISTGSFFAIVCVRWKA